MCCVVCVCSVVCVCVRVGCCVCVYVCEGEIEVDGMGVSYAVYGGVRHTVEVYGLKFSQD